MDRKPELERELLDLLSTFSPTIEVANDAYQLSVSLAAKRAEVVWPHPFHEVFFDFWEGDRKVLSESFEFYEGESDTELIEYLSSVLDRFLTNAIRVQVQGKFLKTTELQYQQGDVWNSVF
ncbi:hypothetical protein Marme_2778 [Marinomonas mediterranea MMB-1]|jgi:hypothetical protein|uniref:Uncharacterized protein n=2 Tax=Marinomonas mediterranea TaxID=119864 RepID=F2JZ27_MARM1|nr:hypothetical protein Marme_2778 [Marinomonas mediterranea MMB-1]